MSELTEEKTNQEKGNEHEEYLRIIYLPFGKTEGA